jgi:hypothetical protein
MEEIRIEIRIDKTMDVDVRIDEVIDGINQCEMKRRWNYIGQIINQIEVDLSELTDSQKETICNYLKKKIELFS